MRIGRGSGLRWSRPGAARWRAPSHQVRACRARGPRRIGLFRGSRGPVIPWTTCPLMNKVPKSFQSEKLRSDTQRGGLPNEPSLPLGGRPRRGARARDLRRGGGHEDPRDPGRPVRELELVRVPGVLLPAVAGGRERDLVAGRLGSTTDSRSRRRPPRRSTTGPTPIAELGHAEGGALDRIRVHRGGGAPRQASRHELRQYPGVVLPATTDAKVLVTVKDDARIVGKVTDTDGDPVPGVLVRAKGAGRDRTDADGEYEIDVPERARKYVVTPSLRGQSSSRESAPSPSGPARPSGRTSARR